MYVLVTRNQNENSVYSNNMNIERPNRSGRAFEGQGEKTEEEVSFVIGLLKFSVDPTTTFSPHDLYHEYALTLERYCAKKGKQFSNPFHCEEQMINAEENEYDGTVEMYGDMIASYDSGADDPISYRYDNLKRGVRKFLAELDGTK